MNRASFPSSLKGSPMAKSKPPVPAKGKGKPMPPMKKGGKKKDC